MIEIIATADSLTQADALLKTAVDTVYIGEETFGLRLPHSFSRAEQQELVEKAHQAGKKVYIAVNGIMHPEKMKLIPEYLDFLETIMPDQIVVGDPGIIYLLRKRKSPLAFSYDGATLVTNARQINFWHKKGAVGAVLAREVPFGEMRELIQHVEVPVEVLVYGATCIHHSKRPLLQNYYNFTQMNERKDRERDLFVSEPRKPETHYSIYEDSHGTHVFANNDVDLMLELSELSEAGFTTWKLDGLYTPGANFVAIAELFAKARTALSDGTWDQATAEAYQQQLTALHPENRGLDSGFYHIDPHAIK